jgi:hypothetical protein
VKKRLRAELEAYLKETGDPRVLGNDDVWESYPSTCSTATGPNGE